MTADPTPEPIVVGDWTFGPAGDDVLVDVAAVTDAAVELAISLDQPYPALIVAGVKGWETRPSPPAGPMRPDGVRPLPGCAVQPGERIAIHATAKRPAPNLRLSTGDDVTFAEWLVSYVDCGPALYDLCNEERLELPLGAVVATAVVAEALPIVAGLHHPDLDDAWITVLVDVRATRLILRRRTVTGITDESISDQLPYGDWRPGRWAWRLSDVRPVGPIPCRGAQGVWRLPRRVQEALGGR